MSLTLIVAVMMAVIIMVIAGNDMSDMIMMMVKQ